MLWNRKSSEKPGSGNGRPRRVGLDVTASRARAVMSVAGPCAAVPLDDMTEELPLYVSLLERRAEVGLAGLALVRKMPHLVATNFLPRLGQPHAWTGPRLTLAPEGCLAAVFDKLRAPLSPDTEALAITLPAYLTLAQMKAVRDAAIRVKLPVLGVAPAAMMIAAHRAQAVLEPATVPMPTSATADPPAEWVVPIRSADHGPGHVVILDADEHALSATIVHITPTDVRRVAAAVWPRASQRLWFDRLLDGIADRCVRVCRRDPRDSADAEQALFEQIEMLVERAAANQATTITLRSEHWYQDLTLTPADLQQMTAKLAGFSTEALSTFVTGANLPLPPRAVWLSADAGRLPGLAQKLYENMPERTQLSLLPASAAAEAAAAFLPRWQAGTLPGLLDDHLMADPKSASSSGPSTNRVSTRAGG
ncbi:MAG: hypothetical protein ACRCZF_03165 [Gemmataceae bacterium]